MTRRRTDHDYIAALDRAITRDLASRFTRESLWEGMTFAGESYLETGQHGWLVAFERFARAWLGA